MEQWNDLIECKLSVCSSWKDFLIPPKYQSTERMKTVIATKWNHSRSKQQKCAENLESKQMIPISKEMQDFSMFFRVGLNAM